MEDQAALLMIRRIQAVSQQRLPVRATDSTGDGHVRLDCLNHVFECSGGGLFEVEGASIKVFKRTLDGE